MTFAMLLKDLLENNRFYEFETVIVDKIHDAIDIIPKNNFNAVLLDLNLPDSKGMETVKHLKNSTYDLPIVVITSDDDANQALKSVSMGMKDYLIKGQLDPNTIIRSIIYAIERHKTHMILKVLAIIDEMTGLCNRRGFISLAGKQIKQSKRFKRNMTLFNFDLDSLKEINDKYGHKEGDNAIIQTAKLINEVFRESEITARIGGDEFLVLAIDTNPEDINIIINRIKETLKRINSENKNYKISLSIGYSDFDPIKPKTLDQLIEDSDKMMYENKKRAKKNRN